MAKQTFQNVRGTFDILPSEHARYDLIAAKFQRLTATAGFGLIDTPIMEEA